MSFMDRLRNGLRFVLMSVGISSPAKKPGTQNPPAEGKS